MQWYPGTIEDAIVASKKDSRIFVVYVKGEDKSSEEMSEIINKPEISTILESNKYICVKIDSPSYEFDQFVAIFKQVPVPSLFLIGLNGIPIAVINNLSGDVNTTLTNIYKVLSEQEITAFSCHLDGIPEQKLSTDVDFLSSQITNKEKENSELVVNNSEVNNLKEKESGVVEAEIIVKEKDSGVEEGDIAIKEKDSSVEEEITSKPKLIDPKQIMEYNKEKNLFQERRQEILRQNLDRQRILRDIEADKEERISRQKELFNSDHSGPVREETIRSFSYDNTSEIRNRRLTCIQFRKPDGSSVNVEFNIDLAIRDLRDYVKKNILDASQFDLATSFPRRVFTIDENEKTLFELGLIPNAVVLVIPNPADNRFSLVSYVYSTLSSAVWFILSPVVTTIRYLREYI